MSAPQQQSHSTDPEQEMPRVLVALHAVFLPNANNGSNNPSILQEANNYLTSFQRTAVAWQVCDRLLHSSTGGGDNGNANVNLPPELITQVHFFAAQTLHTKCQMDKLQLREEDLPSLRDSLMAHLSRFCSTGSNGSIVTQIAMALCALAVQMQWKTIISDIFAETTEADKMNANTLQLKLQICQLLPEETTSHRLLLQDNLYRETFLTMLREHANKVFEFLWFCISMETNTTATAPSPTMCKIQELVLQCLQSWIHYIDIPPTLLQAAPLVEYTFQIIQSSTSLHQQQQPQGNMLDLAVDVIVELLRCYPSHHQSNQGLIEKMIPLLMALTTTTSTTSGQQQQATLSPFHTALETQEEDAMRAFCRIFTEMGEAYMSLIVSHENLNQAALVELVLACSAIPDHDIANITLHFWYRFVSSLEDIHPLEYRQYQVDNFTPQLIKLISTCITLLKYDSDEDLHTQSADRIDDIERQRFYVADTLEDCCRLLGGDIVLQNIGARLQEECQKLASSGLSGEEQLRHWHGIEACLFALKGTSRYVSGDEDKVLPFVMTMVKDLYTSSPYLRNTVNLMVGEYASWLDSHPDYLEPILQFLAQGLSSTAESEKKCSSSAAYAIKQLCIHCNSKFELGNRALQLYGSIVTAQMEKQEPILDLKDELEVLEGACCAVSRQLQDFVKTSNPNPEETISSYVGGIVQPAGNRLVALAAEGSNPGPKQIAAEVERLTVIVRFLNVPNTPGQNSDTQSARSQFVIDLMTQLWPYLDTISQKHPTDFNVAEKVCRLHKYAMRGCGATAYAPMLDPLRTHLTNNYTRSCLSPYLYAASICIAEFGKDPKFTQALFEMINSMSQRTFEFLSSIEMFTSHPDIVEELFFLASRIVTVCPVPFISSPLLHSYLQVAIVGMKQDHKDANRGTLNFIETTIGYGLSVSHIECKESLERALATDGKNIVANLIGALEGNLPCYRITASSGSVAGILYKLNELCPAQLMKWLNEIFGQSDRMKTRLVEAIRQKVHRNDLFHAAEMYASMCDRERKMGR